MKRTTVFSILLIVTIFAFASQSASADEITLAGTTSSTNPLGVTFALGSFNGTTSGGFAGFSDLGSYTLSTTAGIYTNDTLALTAVFTLPVGINGGSTTSFAANLFGNVNTNAQGGVDIVFTNPSQTLNFSNVGGTGTFTFNLNNVALNPGGTTTLSGYVTGASFTPTSVPESSTILLLGAGLLLMPLLRIKGPLLERG
jgi:hypothetical protein